MRINVAIPEAHVDAPVLDSALESVTRLNEKMLEKGEVPLFEDAMHRVRWKPEPPGQEHFDHAGTVLKRGWGDCDDLAPWHAASLRATGEDPEATAVVKRSGPKRWHAVVRRGNGEIEDPSRATGMNGEYGVFGAAIPLMAAPSSVVGGAFIVRPQIALRPIRGAWQARADLPWHWREHLRDKPTPTDYAMTALHTAPVAHTALTGAIDGIIELGEAAGFSDPEHVRRLNAIADCCDGANHFDLVGQYGPIHARAAEALVGSFFGRLARGIARGAGSALHAVTPLASTALQFVPGVGPAAAAALKAADSLARGQMPDFASIIPGALGLPDIGKIASMLPGGMGQLASMIPGGVENLPALAAQGALPPQIAAIARQVLPSVPSYRPGAAAVGPNAGRGVHFHCVPFR